METKILAIKDDITKIKIDAIVNAANRSLLGGGGVDGAIHRAAGPDLLEECRALGGCKTGESKITKGYQLPARHVIHTVGPIYGREDGREVELLRSCYWNSLALAQENGLKSIAFPAISTGAFGYPRDEASRIAIRTVKEFIAENPEAFSNVIFVLFDDLSLQIYDKLLMDGVDANLTVEDLK